MAIRALHLSRGRFRVANAPHDAAGGSTHEHPATRRRRSESRKGAGPTCAEPPGLVDCPQSQLASDRGDTVGMANDVDVANHSLSNFELDGCSQFTVFELEETDMAG